MNMGADWSGIGWSIADWQNPYVCHGTQLGNVCVVGNVSKGIAMGLGEH